MDWGTIIAGILTLAVLTFLYKDNPIYKMAESILIGVSIGYTLVIVWEQTIVDLLVEPLVLGNLYLIIPLILGLLMFSRFIPKLSYLSRIPIALLIGSGAGVAIPVMLEARTMRQVVATVNPLFDAGFSFDFSALVVLIGVISTLAYFYFSREQTGLLGKLAGSGRYFLMIFFGATFGYTVMSRMSTFIGRMEFLLTDFFHLTQ